MACRATVNAMNHHCSLCLLAVYENLIFTVHILSICKMIHHLSKAKHGQTLHYGAANFKICED